MTDSSIVIIDYGMGNLGSIRNMLKHLGVTAAISSQADDVAAAGKLILSGVGAFDSGMTSLENLGLIPLLNKKALVDKVPVLGICLGMQLLSESSEEGHMPGLGWISGKTIRFSFDRNNEKLKIPHMGWNTVESVKPCPLFEGMYDNPRFYFVHSYHVVCNHPDDVLCRTHYGYDIVSAVAHENIYGVQFHPEKSHKYGMKLLENFAGKI